MADPWSNFIDFPQGAPAAPAPSPANPQPGGGSSMTMAPIPNMGGPQYRETEASGQAKTSNSIMDQALASRDSARELERYADLVQASPEDAWGPWKGGSMFQAWRGVERAWDPAADNLRQWHQSLSEQRGRVALPQIKTLIGGIPRASGGGGSDNLEGALSSMITGGGGDSPVQMALSTIPGTDSINKQTAIDGINRARQKYYDDMVNAINERRVNPTQILPTASPKQPVAGRLVDVNGGEIRPGAAFIGPDGNIRRVPVSLPPSPNQPGQ